jgi:hypothetical protein
MAAALAVAAIVTGPAATASTAGSAGAASTAGSAGAAGTAGSAGAASYGPVTPNLTDNLWGGYVAQGSGFGSISGSWVEPDASCTSSQDMYAPWVGIDGYGSQTVEQTGVETNCQNGYPAYRAWYEMYPAAPVYWSDPVSPGDTMTGSVTATGGGGYQITLTDRTAGWTEQTTQYLNGQNVSAEAVIESPTGSYPSFAELDFSSITVNGQVFDAYSPQGLDSGGYTPGPLSNGSFSMTPGGWSWPPSAHHHVSGPARY